MRTITENRLLPFVVSGRPGFVSMKTLPEPLKLRDCQSIPVFIQTLTEVLHDQDKYKQLSDLTGDDAQTILDCLQWTLDSHLFFGSDRTVVIKALTRLARRSGLYPDRLKITELKLFGNEPIGAGSYGNAWKALLGDNFVCVKIMRTDRSGSCQRLIKAFLREGLTWAHLSYHPNIVPFLGIQVGGTCRKGIGLVSELMPNGNVVEYLKRSPSVSRLGLIRDIANGLNHLHSLNMVHGDIKGRNILIDAAGHACLADFGLTNIVAENVLDWSSLSSGSSRFGGTLRWQAPELLCGEVDTDSSPPNTPASDVYSFACAIYEILSDRVPFHEIRSSCRLLVVRVTQPGLLPARRSDNTMGELLNDLWPIMQNGWRYDPAERPQMPEMLHLLEKF